MEKLLLIDGNSIINRAYYGMPDFTDSNGRHTGAVYGFLTILFRLLDEEAPDYLCVAFDVKAPTFRHKVYEQYKGTRKPSPDGLREQIPLLKEVLDSMEIKRIEMAGFEADDLLGTMAVKAEKAGVNVTLVSGDRDLLQITSDMIKVRIPKTIKGETTIFDYTPAAVMEEYKVSPKSFIELKALMGDTSDNIPGIPGVGPKAATDLLLQFGTIENIYKNPEQITKKGLREKVISGKELLDLSLFLVTINTDAPVEFSPSECKLGNLFNSNAFEMFTGLSFKKLLSKFENSDLREYNETVDFSAEFVEVKTARKLKEICDKAEGGEFCSVCCFLDEKRKSTVEADGQISFFSVENNINHILITFSLEKGTVYYLDNEDIEEEAVFQMYNLLKDKYKIIVSHGIKNLYDAFNIELDNALDAGNKFFDIELAQYILNPLLSKPTFADVASANGISIPLYEVSLLNMKFNSAYSEHKTDFVFFACLHAYVAFNSYTELVSKLEAFDELKLFKDIEMPSSFVLFEMEKNGIYVDSRELENISAELKARCEELEASIYEEAGERFNINSPKQLGVILFEKMGMKPLKKTKTGYSTNAEVLEQMKDTAPVVAKILEYRTVAKLRSTYAEGMSVFIKDDERIHSNFNQTITATGRISSDNPNLQNIPMRMEEGRKIRKAFKAPEGRILIDADYSQIELRVLASLAGDSEMIKAFKENQDIHTLTASKVFNVEPALVTSSMRRSAKAVNFGIVYGISAFGLSKDLSISQGEAKNYIESYFANYPGIKDYLDNVKISARDNGYSITYFGRRRPIPELKSSNYAERQFGERVAMNAPIQGSAADIMKIAMVRVYNRLKDRFKNAKLVLQVHDELTVECDEKDANEVRLLLIEEMESAADLSVKLSVSCEQGYTLYDTK